MRWTQILTIVIAILLLAACGPRRRAQVEPPRPTITPVPTFTLTPAGAAVAVSSGQNVQQTQVQPTAEAVPPTATPPPKAMVTIGNIKTNVRAGPSLLYKIIGLANPGEEFEVTGKSPGLGDWWQIRYRSDEERGWVYSQLVTPRDTQNVAVPNLIPAEPTRTPLPPPTATPIPAPTQPPAPQFKWRVGNAGDCHRNDRAIILKGFVVDRAGIKRNDMCVHIDIYGPRQTICTGCPPGTDRAQGFWEFVPFGVAPEGESLVSITDVKFPMRVEIFMVNCPASLRPDGGSGGRFSSNDYADLTPISEKWVRRLDHSSQCNNIDFQEN